MAATMKVCRNRVFVASFLIVSCACAVHSQPPMHSRIMGVPVREVFRLSQERSYAMTYRPIVTGSEEVRLDGKMLRAGTDYRFDYIIGILTIIDKADGEVAVRYDASADEPWCLRIKAQDFTAQLSLPTQWIATLDSTKPIMARDDAIIFDNGRFVIRKNGILLEISCIGSGSVERFTTTREIVLSCHRVERISFGAK